MPELKNTFTGGRMEKDRDERIVGSGLYREALNIEVSTSEDSEVGAAQNILGNTQITSAVSGPPKDYAGCSFSAPSANPSASDLRYHETNTHIAHTVDPQNDKLYRFIATDGGDHGVWMDRVVEYNTDSKIEDPWQLKERAVMVDIYKVATKVNTIEAGPPIPPVPVLYGCYLGNCEDCSTNPSACNAPGQIIYGESTCSGGCAAIPIYGCTDPAYQEYNSLANVDDGSCLTLIPVSGCTDPGYTEYDPLATVDDGSCMTLIPAGPACGWTLPSPSAYTSFEANPVVILTPPQHPSGAGYFASNQGGGYSCLTPGAVCKDKWAQTVAINSNGWSVGVDVGALDIRNLVTKCNVSTRGIYDSPQGPNMKWHGMGWSVRSIINGSLGHLSPSQPVTAAALNDYAASTAFTNSTTQELWWRWRLPYSSTGYGAVWQDAGQTFPSGVAIGSSNPFAQNYTQTPGITFFVYNELLDFCINYLNMPTPPGSIYNKPDLLTNELQNNGSYGGFALGANSIEVVANELELV